MAYDILKGEMVPGDFTMGAPIMTTTEDALQKWNAVRVDTDNLNADITQIWFPKVKAQPAARSFMDAWIRWRDDVYSQYKDNFRRKLIPDLAWGVWNRGDAKLHELAAWRKRFEKISGLETTAPSSSPEAEPPKDKPKGGSMWMWISAALVGAVGLTLIQRKVGS